MREEHRVGRSAAVDLSWTAAASNDAPLFVFEVESTPSTGLANNALKVYGSPLEELVKPLFFFHLVLSGGQDNERIRNAQRLFGQHNYRIYRLTDGTPAPDLALDILRQHRRVSRNLDLWSTATALMEPGWGGLATVFAVLELAEQLRFESAYLCDYARLSMEDPAYVGLFARRVRTLSERPEANGPEGREASNPRPRDGYGGGPGDYISGLLETGIRIYAGDLADEDGPAAFETWMTSCGFGQRMIEPSFGLSRDYDGYVIGTAPIHYALTAALLKRHPRSHEWVIRDLANLLEGEFDRGLRPRFRLPAVLWLAHILAASPTEHDVATQRDPTFFDGLYARLGEHVREGGGLPAKLLLDPPRPFNPSEDVPEWIDEEEVVSLPSREALRAKGLALRGPTVPSGHPTAIQACLSSLISYEVYADPGAVILPLLYAEAAD
ncbi:hypothetical protein [Intrasporangium calvum]|uniref:hypothetical protein n=1 Tax=Intrasporangium calvum TaxID=53358 RepID=UPI0011D2448C|nr:hypothetical protein [Intrasporangium calvum]